MKLISFNNFLLFIAGLAMVFACQDEQSYLWYKNNSKVKAIIYHLDTSDSSKILTQSGKKFSLLIPNDSLKTNEYETHYSKINDSSFKYFLLNANQEVSNSKTPNLVKYYNVNKEDVFLVGFATGDFLKPYTIFSPPLKLRSKTEKLFSTTSKSKNYLKSQYRFNEGFNTSLNVKEVKQLILDDFEKDLAPNKLYKFELKQDAKISYGTNNLILPDATVITSNTIINDKGLLVAEWTIKPETPKTKPHPLNREIDKSQQYYLEYIIYNSLNEDEL